MMLSASLGCNIHLAVNGTYVTYKWQIWKCKNIQIPNTTEIPWHSMNVVGRLNNIYHLDETSQNAGHQVGSKTCLEWCSKQCSRNKTCMTLSFLQCYLIIEAHMHSTVKHDVLASNSDQDAAPANILACPCIRHTEIVNGMLTVLWVSIVVVKDAFSIKYFMVIVMIAFSLEMKNNKCKNDYGWLVMF